MNLFVLSGHGSESFAAFLNGVILQKKTRQLSLQLSSQHITLNPSLTCDVITTSLKSHVSHLIHLITLFEYLLIAT